MRIENRFSVTLNVHPIEFDSDAERNALLLVKETYEKRCYQGFYIREVLRVERISRTRINRVGKIGDGVVDVIFLADCQRLHVNDMVAGMEVVSSSHTIVGKPAKGTSVQPVAMTLLNPNAIIAKGQIIPVRVIEAENTAMQEQASAAVELLTCRTTETIWRVAGTTLPTGSAFEHVWRDFAAAVREAGRIAGDESANATRGLFRNLLASFPKGGLPLLDGFEKTVEIEASDEVLQKGAADLEAAIAESRERYKEWVRSMVAGSTWTRPLELPFDWAGVCAVRESSLKAAVESKRYKVVNAQAGEIAIHLLCNITDAVRLLNETTQVYNTPALLESHLTIFRLMRASQHAAVGALPVAARE
jgi:hypothetical protein